MIGRGRCAAACAALLLAGAGRAEAACSLKTFTIPVKMEGLRPIVSAKVDGQEADFILDSGAFFNGISAKFAYDQKLKAATTAQTGSRVPVGATTSFSGAGGDVQVSGLVQAGRFEFAGTTFKNVVFLTFGNLKDGTGIIGQNFLGIADVEYDFAHGALKMNQPQDCKDGNLAYWVSVGTAYSVLPLDRGDQGDRHTGATVLINGVQMQAWFDTGAAASFITRRAATRAGVKTTDPDVKEAGFSSGLDRTRIKTWVGRFASIKIGDEEIKNGLLNIGESDAADFDVLIGADFFLSHHVYVANSQRKIYFTYEGGRVFNLSGEGQASAQGRAK